MLVFCLTPKYTCWAVLIRAILIFYLRFWLQYFRLITVPWKNDKLENKKLYLHHQNNIGLILEEMQSV